MTPTPQTVDLIAVATHRDHNAVTRFGDACRELDAADLVDGYNTLMACAPQRHRADRRYFVGHGGQPSSGASTNRVEEHLAIALVNDRPRWEMPDGSSVELLDYQVPLKAHRTDTGVGKIDIFGLTDTGVPVVIELKVRGSSTPDTPLRALLEALTYAAILEANASSIRAEISGMIGRTATSGRPNILIAAPDDYWSYWLAKKSAGEWAQACGELANDLAHQLGVAIEMVSIGEPGLVLGLEGRPPRITSDLRLGVVDRWSGR